MEKLNGVDSEINFKNFFETIDDMFFVSDSNGNILTTNTSAIDKLGYSSLDFKKMNLLELHPEESRQEASILLQEMLKKERKFCPIPFISKSGLLYPVESRVWIGKWNKEDCIYAVSKDLTKENEDFQVFTKIFENNSLPMAIKDVKENKLIRVNNALLDSTGYSEEDIIGRNIEALSFIDNSSELKLYIKKKAKGQEVKDKEIAIKRKDGKKLKCLLSIEDIAIQGNKSFLIVLVDITERDELAKSVEEKLQKLTSVIDGTNLGTWEWNISTKEVEVNKHFANMLGYSSSEIDVFTADTFDDFIHPEEQELSNDILKNHLSGKLDYYDIEMRMKHKDGTWVWIHNKGRVTEKDSKGIPIKMFGTYTNISERKQADKKLKESEDRFLLALDQTKAGLWDFDMKNGDVFFSPMLKKILGYEDNEIENSFEILEDLSHPDDKEKLKNAQADYMEGRTDHFELSHRLRHKDGKWRWILTRGGIIRDERGLAKRWIGTNMDITTEYEQSLELERFFSVNLDLLCILDFEGRFIKTNKSWEKMLGYSSEQIEGQSFKKFIHPEDLQSAKEAVEKLKKDGQLNNYINRYLSVDGSYHHIEWKANIYEDVIYSAARDITNRIAYENKILEISNRDSLTNIYNRRYIYNRAEEIIEEYKRTGQEFSICILDIDRFKNINDTYGHQVGDCVLKEFTSLIKENLRSYDLLGRYGGEEFIIILKNSDLKANNSIIQRILQVVRNKTFKCRDFEISFTFSGGISNSNEVDKDKMTIDELINIADKRMYDAKKAGRNKIITTS